jgi:hypothetical protein
MKYAQRFNGLRRLSVSVSLGRLLEAEVVRSVAEQSARGSRVTFL